MHLGSEQWRALIIEGARQFGLCVSQENSRQFEIYAQELLKWNQRVNLTAIIDPFHIAVDHFLDSLAAAPCLPSAAKLLDIGSGGGFPGIPLKILNPSLSVVLIDGVRKKVGFQLHIGRLLTLTDFHAYHLRAEDFREGHGVFDIVISRAVTSLNGLIELSRPFLTPTGTLIAFKGKHAAEEIAQAPSGWAYRVIPYTLPYTQAVRSLILAKPPPFNGAEAEG